MPEKQSPKSRTKRTTITRQPSNEKPKCHIHDELDIWERNTICESVCVNGEDFTKYQGKHYCLFDLPTNKKNVEKFEQHFRQKLENIEKEIKRIETEFLESEWEEEKSKVHYDFQYLWFPSKVDLSKKQFKSYVNFRKATFNSGTNFKLTTFNSEVNFRSSSFKAGGSFELANFEAEAIFIDTTFTAPVDFRSATFVSSANFISATFTSLAYFISTKFKSSGHFREATFTANAYFNSATFEEKSQVFFEETEFSDTLYFNFTEFKGYVAFKGKQDNRLFTGKNALLDLQDARIDNAKKILFHTVRLEPSWFVNTDASEFIFTDCKWYYDDGKRLKIKTELQNLKKRGFENPNALLTKTCWQLAENYEESKSFPEASVFRLMAFESERLDKIAKRKTWFESLLKIFQEQVLCWEIFRKLKVTGEKLWKLLKEFPVDFVHSIYYWLSGFGEKWFRAFCWLLVIWFGFALVYWFVQGFEGNVQISGWDSLGYSLQVMTLQRPEPRPMGFTRVIYGIETILAPLQAALLALAIRRKFMR